MNFGGGARGQTRRPERGRGQQTQSGADLVGDEAFLIAPHGRRRATRYGSEQVAVSNAHLGGARDSRNAIEAAVLGPWRATLPTMTTTARRAQRAADSPGLSANCITRRPGLWMRSCPHDGAASAAFEEGISVVVADVEIGVKAQEYA